MEKEKENLEKYILNISLAVYTYNSYISIFSFLISYYEACSLFRKPISLLYLKKVTFQVDLFRKCDESPPP